jgi:iron(III) transport system substrate-binding protein
MDSAIVEYLGTLADAFVNPTKRMFFGYLIAAFVLALALTLIASRGGRGAGMKAGLRRIFSRSIWWSASAKADYKMIAINQAVTMVVAPRLVTRMVVATAIFGALHEIMGSRPDLGTAWPTWSIVLCFTLCHFLVDDLSKYLVHRALHRWPLLWAFHKVHHSAETLTPLTVYRTHPIEAVVFSLRGVAAQALAVAVFVFFFGSAVDLFTVLGANVFLFLFNATGANLRHSHIRLSYGRHLEQVFISPAQHQIHHSAARRHHDKNFGAVLAIWDRLGGSLCLAENGQELRYGLEPGAENNMNSLKALYLAPFIESARSARTAVRRFSQVALPHTRGLDIARRSLRTILIGVIAALAFVSAPLSEATAGDELNIYSHRQPFLIEPFLDAFTAETGVTVNVVYASKGLVQRLQAEGEASPADIVLTVDIGRMSAYADKDLLAPVDSAILTGNIPAHLRDPANRWFALSKRARVIAIAKGQVGAGEIMRFEDLADPKWEGRICTRPGSHVYNRALMASMIAAHGEEDAEAWARGLVANLARRPQGNDRAQVKAIYEGVCDIAVINSYYYGKLKSSDIPEQRDWAAAIDIVFTNQADRGAHINISGAGVAKYSKNKPLAVQFLEFLTQETAQTLYGTINYEYPVNPSIAPIPEIRSWGDFKEDQVPIARIAELGPTAQRIIDRTGW